MKIKLFYHLYAINSWYTIFIDQLRILLTSGLYDACEEVNIGFIGFAEDKQLFDRLFVALYPKLKIRYYSNEPTDYEFPTLKLIEDNLGGYVGFYFHTKAVTRPFEPIINQWRLWIEEAVLNRWPEHYKNVCDGYDASSVNYLTSPDHFSGNFWWFNRDYILRLPPIDSLDKHNRFHAEQWICMCADKRIYSKEFVEPGRDTFLIQYKPSI